jgi:hypothetical protein
MKKIIIMSCLGFVTAFSSIAQDNSRSSERAKRLSDKMIQDLRLNNYQASRIRAINQEKVNQMMEIERKYAGNPELVDKNCKGVCKQRDKEVESFLSSDQFGQYFSARNQYYKSDRDFASQIGLKNRLAVQRNIPDLPIGESVSPAEAKTDPVIKPADTK